MFLLLLLSSSYKLTHMQYVEGRTTMLQWTGVPAHVSQWLEDGICGMAQERDIANGASVKKNTQLFFMLEREILWPLSNRYTPFPKNTNVAEPVMVLCPRVHIFWSARNPSNFLTHVPPTLNSFHPVLGCISRVRGCRVVGGSIFGCTAELWGAWGLGCTGKSNTFFTLHLTSPTIHSHISPSAAPTSSAPSNLSLTRNIHVSHFPLQVLWWHFPQNKITIHVSQIIATSSHSVQKILLS